LIRYRAIKSQAREAERLKVSLRLLKCFVLGHIPGERVKVLGIEVRHCMRCATPVKQSGHFWPRQR